MAEGDDDELEMFVEAQDAVWGNVMAELTAGRKRTHWMWFVFPQLARLGHSDMSQLYGLHDLNEAADYYAHPVLGPRLETACTLIMNHAGTEPQDILGTVDAKKLRSCVTLFARVPGASPVFSNVLTAFYDADPCPVTDAAIS